MEGLHRFAYSQGMAFKVQLSSTADRDQWQVKPVLTLLVATSAESAGVNGWAPMNSTTKLAADWCGLVGGNALTAVAIRGELPPAQWPALLTSAVQPELLARLTSLYEGAPMSNLQLLQTSLYQVRNGYHEMCRIGSFPMPEIS